MIFKRFVHPSKTFYGQFESRLELNTIYGNDQAKNWFG